MDAHGIVVALRIAAAAAAPMVAVGSVQAVAGEGLQGDRYFNKIGTFSQDPGSGRDVTLIESEALEALKRDYGLDLDPGLTRRNLITRGVALNHLVERRFRIGEAILRGTRLCDPCAHLEKLTGAGVVRGLIHRGGLRAEIVTGGVIRAGDAVVPLDE